MKLKYVFRNLSTPFTDEQFEEVKRYVEKNHLKRGAWVAGLILEAISTKEPVLQSAGEHK